jgi:MerR family mercuric resistance operon transcriptional regulator
MLMNILTVGQLARKAHIHLESVRYYEKLGLMPVPKKNASGYRPYSEQDISCLVFIKHAQELGFSLKEI